MQSIIPKYSVWLEPNELQETKHLIALLQQSGLKVTTTLEPDTIAGILLLPDDNSPAQTMAQLSQLPPQIDIILVTHHFIPGARTAALSAGAADLVALDDAGEELCASIHALIKRREADIDRHPLTGLPGGTAMYRRLEASLPDRGQLGFIAFDLAQFKPFNDHYGFERGDRAICLLAEILQEVIKPSEGLFHPGGDDFFVVTHPSRLQELADVAIQNFSARVSELHDAADLTAGFIPGRDRATGKQLEFPLLQLKATAVTNNAQDVQHLGILFKVIAELKQFLRSHPQQNFIIDRRSHHNADDAWHNLASHKSKGE